MVEKLYGSAEITKLKKFIAFKYKIDPENVQDIIAESFTIYLEKKLNLTNEVEVKNYIAKIAYNKTFEFIRNKLNKAKIINVLDTFEEPKVLEKIEQIEQSIVINKNINALRNNLSLTDFSICAIYAHFGSLRKVEKHLGIKKHNVQKAIKNAKNAIKK